MTYLYIFLIYLFIQIANVSAGGSPTHLRIGLKLNLKNRNKDSQVCTTAICNKTAQQLLKYIDFEVDPCQDFYQFSCGNILKKEMPPGKNKIGSIVDVVENVKQNVKDILEGPPSETKNNFEKQTKMSFQSCVDTTAIDNDGAKALKEVLKKFGGWPLVEGDKWKEEECNLTTIFTKYQLHGMLSIFYVFTDDILRLVPFRLRDDPYKANSTILGIYKQYALNASLYLGEMEKSDNFTKAVDDIFDFESSVYKCQLDQTDSLNMTNVEALKKIFEKTFDIESFFKSFYKHAGLDLEPDEKIIIHNPPYFNCLAKLLNVTSKRKIVNYLVWNMIQSSSVAMPKQFVEFSNTFKSKFGLPSNNIIRRDSCIDIISDNLEYALDHLYVIRHFSQASKNKVLDLLKRIKKAFKRLIANENWLSKDSKVAMIAKIDQMRDIIGYPDYIYDPRFIAGDFNGVDFSGQSFLEIFLTINMMKVKDKLRMMKNPDLVALYPITMVNGYHDERTNSIAFSLGMLTSPYYAESFPMNLNFGSIGTVMGHEITHALDVLGRKVVVNGVATELLGGETRENFLKRSECIIKQFHGIPIETGVKLDGNNTRYENAADAGGLRAAYMSYKRWLNEYGEEKQLPGIPYNSEQMFFISRGMSMCRRHTNETPEYEPGGLHPPHRIRINMSLKNFKTFSKVFKCNANSEMNLSERCKLW